MPQTKVIPNLGQTTKLITGETFTSKSLYDTQTDPHIYSAFLAEEDLIYNDKRGSEGFGYIDFREGESKVFYNKKTGELTIQDDQSEEYSIEQDGVLWYELDIFSTVWDTSLGDASNSITLPLTSTGTYNFVVDWGDGSTDTITEWDQAETVHAYASGGIYIIKIKGIINGWKFYYAGDYLKFTKILNWGSFVISNNEMFGGCENLTSIEALDVPTITTTSFSEMFQDCGFEYINRLNEWDVSSVTSLDSTFAFCLQFNQDISDWDVSNVISFVSTFSYTSFNQPLNNWDVSSATSMVNMLQNTPFNQPLNNWDVSSVVSFSSMFQNTPFNQDIGMWDLTGCTFGFVEMFDNDDAFDQDISGWQINQITAANNFMRNATGLSNSNYEALLISWSSQNPNTGISIHFGGSKYTSNALPSRSLLSRASATRTISSATDNGSGLVRIVTSTTHGRSTGDKIFISGLVGTVEANGDWIITVINTTTFDLQGSSFVNPRVSGGTVRTGYGWTITDGGAA